MSQTQRNTELQCIKTILLSSTTMLEPGQNYYVHFSELPATPSPYSSDLIYRTPSIYLKPGYKVYLMFNYCQFQILTQSGYFSLKLEKSEKDESLPRPIPNDLEITVEQVETTESRQPLTISTATFQRLCKVCNPSINLSRVGTIQVFNPSVNLSRAGTIRSGCSELTILKWKQQMFYPIEKSFYAKVTFRKHQCFCFPVLTFK